MDKKIEEAREFLQTIGMPKAQQAEICCYVIYKNPDGIQMPDGDIVHTLYVEMKNKHESKRSPHGRPSKKICQKIFISFQNIIL